MPLTTEERHAVRQLVSKRIETPHPKAVYNAAGDAFFDLLQAVSTRNAIRNAVNAATSPVVLTNQEIRLVGAAVFLGLFNLDKVG